MVYLRNKGIFKRYYREDLKCMFWVFIMQTSCYDINKVLQTKETKKLTFSAESSILYRHRNIVFGKICLNNSLEF